MVPTSKPPVRASRPAASASHAFAHTLKSFRTASGPGGKLYSLPALAAQFPRIVEAAALNREPHRIAFYLGDLAAAFHAFFNLGNNAPARGGRVETVATQVSRRGHDGERGALRPNVAFPSHRLGADEHDVIDGGIDEDYLALALRESLHVGTLERQLPRRSK